MKKKKKSRCVCNPRLGYYVCKKKSGKGFTHHPSRKCKKKKFFSGKISKGKWRVDFKYPNKPWIRGMSPYENRRDAERYAKILKSPETNVHLPREYVRQFQTRVVRI